MSCVYVAHLARERSYPPAMVNAIADLWTDNGRGGTSIITSSLTVTEVTECLLMLGLKAELEEFQSRFSDGLHESIDVDPVIADRAARYRVHYQKHPLKHPNKPDPFTNLTTADAIHCATAVIYGAKELWTFDGIKSKNDKQRSIKLLWLGNRVADDDLLIVAPTAGELRLL